MRPNRQSAITTTNHNGTDEGRLRAKFPCGRCELALRSTLTRADLSGAVFNRERQIVVLVGEGLTSPAIGQPLPLSVRTGQGHIYRAMAKTGVHSRGGLAALLRRREPEPCGTVPLA